MSVPKFLQPYLASYDLSKLDKDSPSVKRELITQVLNLGDEKAVLWIFKNYTLTDIKDTIRNPQRGAWFEDSYSYWGRILDIKGGSRIPKKAVLRINPI